MTQLEQLAAGAAQLHWSIDEYGTVITPDRRTAEMNGFATICGYGEAQQASKARARLVVDIVNAFPGLVAELTALRQKVARQ